MINKNDAKKEELKKYFGQNKFDELYSMCLFFRTNESEDENFQKQ